MYETGCITSIVDAVVVADGTTNCGRQADPRAGAVSSEDGEASKEGLIWSAALFGDATEWDSSSRGEIGAGSAAADSNTGSSDSSMTNATELAVEQREIAFEG